MEGPDNLLVVLAIPDWSKHRIYLITVISVLMTYPIGWIMENNTTYNIIDSQPRNSLRNLSSR